MEIGSYPVPVTMAQDWLRVISVSGPDFKIVEKRELADGSLVVVLHRPYFRIRAGTIREKIRAEIVLGKINEHGNLIVMRIVRPGVLHKTALQGFIRLLRQMR